MPTNRRIRPNALGDLRAEADRAMLSTTFLETSDYHTLIETSDRPIVVGRARYWQKRSRDTSPALLES